MSTTLVLTFPDDADASAFLEESKRLTNPGDPRSLAILEPYGDHFTVDFHVALILRDGAIRGEASG